MAVTNLENNLLKYDDSKHTYPPNANRSEIAKVSSQLKHRAKTTNDRPVQIVQDVTAPLTLETRVNLPSRNALKKQAKRVRRVDFPPEPRSLENVNLPAEFKITLRRENFCRDIIVGDGHILLFVTDDSIRRLSEAEFWLCDGTFKTVSNIFIQLYTIHAPSGRQNNYRIIPFAYALMTSKSEMMYRELFKEMNELATNLNVELHPDFILTDFELASMNALRAEFPGVENKGCNFHLCKSVWRHVQNFSLAGLYGTDNVFSVMVRHLPALSFLPAADIPQAFDALKLIMPREADRLVKYFENTYIRERLRRGHNRRSRAVFEPRIWSVNDNWELDFPRTTNHVEAWHRRWDNLIGRAHIGLYSMIREIKKEQATSEAEVENTIRGEQRPKISNEQQAREAGLNTIMENRHITPTNDFLRAIAHRLEL
jgi:hypothetical protein